MSGNKPMRVETRLVNPMVPWEGSFRFPMFHRLGRELDAMFDRFGFEPPVFESAPTMWNPQLEVFTKEHEFLVKVDLPGVKKEDITVEVNQDHLVLRGERKHEQEEKKDGFFRTERSYGSFYRSLPLPEGVKSEVATATMHSGVLEISMPMTKVEAKSRKLEIAEPVAAKVTKAA